MLTNDDHFPHYNNYQKYLSGSLLFGSLSPRELNNLLSHFRLEQWEKGVQKNREISKHRFHIILGGRMELLSAHPITGKQYTVLILKKADVYGLSNLSESQEQELIPIALDRLLLLSAPILVIRNWISEHPEFNLSLLLYLTKRLRLYEQVSSDLALLDIPTRLARIILRQIPSDTSSTHKNRTIKLMYSLSNEELAKIIGSVRQVVNKFLQQLKKEGVIHFEGKNMIIDNLKLLEKKALVVNHHYLEKQI